MKSKEMVLLMVIITHSLYGMDSNMPNPSTVTIIMPDGSRGKTTKEYLEHSPVLKSLLDLSRSTQGPFGIEIKLPECLSAYFEIIAPYLHLPQRVTNVRQITADQILHEETRGDLGTMIDLYHAFNELHFVGFCPVLLAALKSMYDARPKGKFRRRSNSEKRAQALLEELARQEAERR